VARAEIDGARLDLLDAGTAADRLVVDLDAGLPVVDVEPLGIDRVGERGAGARERLREGGARERQRESRRQGRGGDAAYDMDGRHDELPRVHDWGLLKRQ